MPKASNDWLFSEGATINHSGEKLPRAPVSTDQFTNEELAIALLNPALRYRPQTIRLGAAMLRAVGNAPERLARLTRMELAETAVRYVAEAGQKYEAENRFWTDLLARLRASQPPKPGVLPHPTRLRALSRINCESK